MNTISFFGFAYRVEREPLGTQRQARSSERMLRELRENFVTIVVKNKTFMSEWFGHGIAKRTCAPTKQAVF